MIRKFAVLALAVAAIGFMVSSAEAGGTSGAKKSSTIRVKNYNLAADAVYAVLVPNGTAAPTTQAQANALGGQTIAGNSVKAFPVAPGIGYLAAIYVADVVNPLPPALVATQSYNVTKAGLTGYMAIAAGGPPGPPVILVGPAAGGPF